MQARIPSASSHASLPVQTEALEKRLQTIFGKSMDLIIEPVHIGGNKGLVCYLQAMADLKTITDRILHPLSAASALTRNEKGTEWSTENWTKFGDQLFAGILHEYTESEQSAVQKLLGGYTLVAIDGIPSVLLLFAEQSNKRSISEPSTQTIIKGPKESFIEDLFTNLNLLRKRIKNASLRFESFTIGKETGTGVVLAYIDGIINNEILEEIRTRLHKINTNAILESATVEEFVTDKSFTPFPLVYNTERPDTVTAHLLSGKAAILVDGTPFVLTVPVIFNDFAVSSEDYYQSFFMGSFLRLIRHFAFMISLLLPSMYVAVISFHHELIPTPLIITILAQREGVPFPAVVEAFLMELTFEILREAGVRMPRAVGGTISIVGGLVIGQAAVEAGIISNAMVIVVALTAIASFVAPVYNFSNASRLLRFVFMIIAGFMGLYGVLLGLMMMVGHLCSLRSFGISYLSPIAPFFSADQKDTFVRFPAWSMKKRPETFRSPNQTKQPNAHNPSPPSKDKVDNQ
ncbi:spore germination protein [Paenibacillus turpanensis]|uniref:spore germination protein n=1 Tax=Paenibacillus turpanensis TaxID=2689078 RepID=UPI001409CA26|nr:spore germination protein [Paenibacillus turpanensis]